MREVHTQRSVRSVVVQRKISGGTRSAQGTQTFCALATLFSTWRAQNLDPLLACRQLLLAPSSRLLGPTLWVRTVRAGICLRP